MLILFMLEIKIQRGNIPFLLTHIDIYDILKMWLASYKTSPNQKDSNRCPLFYRSEACIALFSPNLDLPSATVAPKNWVSHSWKDLDIRNLNSLLSIKMTSWGLHSLSRSEEARTHLGKCWLHLLEAPGSAWYLLELPDLIQESSHDPQTNLNLKEGKCE